jgi:hypothetical protein
MSESYKERVGRYRVMRHDELPEEHKAAYRAEGINPDDLWSLVWSFDDEAAAIKCLADEESYPRKYSSWKVVDGGEAVEIERSAWL